MGQLEKSKAERAKTSRGGVDNDKRLAKLKGAAAGGEASWGNASPEWIAAVIVLVSSAGGAVRFGLSRDKGSYSIGLYLGAENETIWFNGDTELNDALGELYVKLQGILGT